MAISRQFNGSTLFKPGSFSKTTVSSAGGFPLSPTGVIGIIGEATGGAPGSSAGVETYTSADINALVAKYKSGPIVDAAKLLVAPARDARVPNGASIIRVYKTNSSTQASRALKNSATVTVFNIASKNYGEDENLISIKVEAGTTANQKVFTIVKGSKTEALPENAAIALMSIQYTGSNLTATATIQIVAGAKTLAISAGADSLSINLVGKSISDLVDIIDSHDSYTASSSYSKAKSKPAIDLDFISTNMDVKTAAVTLRGVQKEMLDILNTSTLISASQVVDIEGHPVVMGRKFLSGGTLGSSSNSSFQAGFDQFLTYRINTVIPLVAQDASALALIGETDPSSSFTVSAVNLQCVSHCILASNTKNRSERNCYVGFKDSFANSMEYAQNLGSERATVAFQDVYVLDAQGNLSWRDPWALSCMAAGIQAGTDVGTPATFKVINALGLRHQDYNPKTQVDLAIEAGLMPIEERDQGGIRIVVHNTSYGADANFVYNRVSVLEAADYVAFNLRQQLEAIFVGGKTVSSLAEDVKVAVESIMGSFLRAAIIVADDTSETGFKNLLVQVDGNTVLIDITIIPVQGVDFILPSITLDTIQQSA